MTSYKVTRDINASAKVIWDILTDPRQLATPAFGIVEISGDIKLGGRIKLTSEVDPKRAFSLRVIELERERKMVWSGGMPFGLFTGTRVFTLSPSGIGVSFAMEETFAGALSGLITKSMPDLQSSFEKFGDALKEGAEA